jgi:hypothetical protein
MVDRVISFKKFISVSEDVVNKVRGLRTGHIGLLIGDCITLAGFEVVVEFEYECDSRNESSDIPASRHFSKRQ